jgi:hypothetical protein
MDDKVQGNIAKLLVSLGLAENLGQAMEFEDRVTVYAKIGQRFIDLKVWAIDGYISQKDFEFWKDLPLTLGYYYDSISKYQTEKSTADATYENHS